jgi:glyoxylase-like metal-dependent hydrolase (beta-lactamase superfamily II)
MLPIPGLHAIPAGNPGPLTGGGNWTYLFTGRVPTIIDAGEGRPAHIEAIVAALESVGQRLQQVVVTHDHRDHSSGTVALLARWPEARCLKWLSLIHRRADPQEVSWMALQDGETIDAGDERIVVVHTPGHAPDHICLWHEPSRTLFGGDLLVEGGTVVVPGGRGGNLRQYLASLTRVAALEPLVVLPAHGEVIPAPAALIEQYGAHRAVRERQVVAAIAAGADSVAAIVDRVYSDLTPERRAAAAETVMAHLDKLREEERVVETDGRVTLIR